MNSKVAFLAVVAMALVCVANAAVPQPVTNDLAPGTIWDWSTRLSPEREICFACTALVSMFNHRGLVKGVAQKASQFVTHLCDTQRNVTRGSKLRGLVCELSPILTQLVDLDTIDPTLAPEATCGRAKACEGAAAWWDKNSNLGQIAAGVAPDKVTGPLVDVIKRGSGVKNSWEVTFTFSSGFSAVPNVVTNPQWDDSITYPESLCVMAATYFHTCSDNINSAYYVQYLADGAS